MELGQLDIVDYKNDNPDLRALDHFGLMAALRGYTKGDIESILMRAIYPEDCILYADCVRQHFSHNGITAERYDIIRRNNWEEILEGIEARSR